MNVKSISIIKFSTEGVAEAFLTGEQLDEETAEVFNVLSMTVNRYEQSDKEIQRKASYICEAATAMCEGRSSYSLTQLASELERAEMVRKDAKELFASVCRIYKIVIE